MKSKNQKAPIASLFGILTVATVIILGGYGTLAKAESAESSPAKSVSAKPSPVESASAKPSPVESASAKPSPVASSPLELSFKAAVNAYWTATQKGDWERVVSYFLPAKLESLGGMEQAKAAMAQAMAPLKITNYKLGDIQVEHDEDDIYVGVSNITFEADRSNQLNGKTYHIKSETGLVGFTENKGKTWYFVGVTPAERNLLASIVPNLFQTMRVPQEKVYVLEDGKWEPISPK